MIKVELDLLGVGIARGKPYRCGKSKNDRKVNDKAPSKKATRVPRNPKDLLAIFLNILRDFLVIFHVRCIIRCVVRSV